jgi:hypothetical protein
MWSRKSVSASISGWLLACLALGAVGCAYVPTTRMDYTPAGPRFDATHPLVLAVEPLQEGRPPRSMPSLQGRLFATYIPLLPYIKIPYERIDEHHLLALQQRGGSPGADDVAFPVAISRAIARDLEQSGLFREVRVAHTAEAAAGADLVLGGVLRSTEFDVYATSYMLGMPGVLLWLLPIPMGSNAATVDADLALRDSGGKQVWSHHLQGRASQLYTMYNAGGGAVSSKYRLDIKRYGDNDEGIDGDSLWAFHASALRQAMVPARESLAAFLGSGSSQ